MILENMIRDDVKNMPPSGIRKYFDLINEMEDVISLGVGEPDFVTPWNVREAGIYSLEMGETHYSANAGFIELREEIAKYLDRKYDLKYNPKDEILVTVGGSEALFNIFTALINKDDKVLIPTPAYPAYESIVTMLGGKVVNYSLDDEFKINVNDIEDKIKTMNIKYLVLSLPSNPTGAILSKEEKEKFINIIRTNDIIVITDEIYEALCYEKYYSVAQCDDIKQKIIYVGGFSKMFSMTGLRIGYYACCSDLMNEIIKVHQYNVSCAPSICQWAVYNGLKNGLNDVEYMKNVFSKRKEFVVNRLKEIGLEVVIPKGAFYVFPSIKQFNMKSEEFALRLLKKEKVACVPGSAFGKGGEGYLRLSYCYSDEELEEGLKRIERFIKTLNK